MKKNTILTLLIGVASVWIHSSCEDIIDVDLNSVEPELVIEGSIRMGEAAEILITKTKDFDAPNEYPPIRDAIVFISDDAGNEETLQCNAEGRYVATNIIGAERKTYKLSVKFEDIEYTATTYMPPRVEIESLSQWQLPIMDYPAPQVHFMDPVGEENQYYRYVLLINGVRPTLKDRLREQLLSTEFTDGSRVSMPVPVRYDIDRDDDNDHPIKSGDEVTVEMQCIDKGVYKFFETLYNVDDALANPISNIKGGALGYFGAYSYTTASIILEWDD